MPSPLSGTGTPGTERLMDVFPESRATDIPTEEHGLSLLRPPTETAELRHRRERPAAIGRHLLIGLGVVCAGASSALWITTHVSPVAVSLLGFGLFLVALGATLHLVLLRDRERWPEEAHAWEEGIELLLHDGELRAAAWTDPKLALDIFVHPRRRSTEVERLLVWRMDAAIPPCDLSERGLGRLMEVVRTHELQLAEYRSGRKDREARAYEIRGRRERRRTDQALTSMDPSPSAP